MAQFPRYFLWGAATASYQVEGGIDNCDWAVAARAGKVPECGAAVDHYNRYNEDFDLAKSLGHTAHRISVEWARIEPKEGEFDKEAILHYQNVLIALKDRGIEPFVTAWHFTLPDWFVAKGGWLAKDSAEIFARFFARIVGDLCGYCRHFATINEPLVYASNSFKQGNWPPFEKSNLKTFRITRSLIKAHKLAYRKAKKECPASEIGIVKHNIYFHVSDTIKNPIAKLYHWIRVSVRKHFWNHYFLNAIRDDVDSIGINYYFHNEEGRRGNSSLPKSDMGWELYPKGLEFVLRDVAKYKKWVFVSEAGLADKEDEHRSWYIKEMIKAMRRAIDNGVDLRGYMYWSLLDNYEWAFGFEPRFGLIEIDRETLKRNPRPSAFEFAKIIANNGDVGML